MSLQGPTLKPSGLLQIVGKNAARAALGAIKWQDLGHSHNLNDQSGIEKAQIVSLEQNPTQQEGAQQQDTRNKHTECTADRGLALLRGAKEQGLVTALEIIKLDLTLKLLSRLMRRASRISCKIVDEACRAGKDKESFIQAVSQIMDVAGIEKCTCEHLVSKLQSSDKKEKAEAVSAIKKLLTENIDSVSKVKQVVNEASNLNEKTDRKIAGIEKIKSYLDRFERYLHKFVQNFRERIGDTPKRLFQNEKRDPKAEIKEVPLAKIAAVKIEDAKSEKADSANSHTAMLNTAVESLQRANEILVDIEEIRQEIEYLHSKVKPFESADEVVEGKLLELEAEEGKKRKQLSFHLGQASWNMQN